MNKSQAEAIKIKVEDALKAMSALHVEAEDVSNKEKEVKRLLDTAERKETGLKTSQDALEGDRKVLDRDILRFEEQKKSFEGQKDSFNKQEERFQDRKLEIAEREKTTNTKIKELKRLQDKEAELEATEESLNQKAIELQSRESVVKKEKKLSRERRQMMDRMQVDLERKQDKVQKFLEL